MKKNLLNNITNSVNKLKSCKVGDIVRMENLFKNWNYINVNNKIMYFKNMTYFAQKHQNRYKLKRILGELIQIEIIND